MTTLFLKRRKSDGRRSNAAARAAKKPVKKQRNLTPVGRKRIVEAVKWRWAEQKKATAK
jgi:hypothetical protein